MVYGSLFSGIGGIDLGFDRAGWECAFQCEVDPYATTILERHWPDTFRFADIEEVSADELVRAGPVDLLAGGFPCQDVSLAGRRAGLAGDRSGLFFEFVRVAAFLAPRWLLIENVPGLLSSGGRRDMGAVLGALVDLGYCVAWRVLDAQYFGLAQRRKRLFLVGHLGTAPAPPLEVLLDRDGRPGDPPPGREARTPVAAGARGSAYGDGVIAPALTSKMAKGTGGPAGDEHQNLVMEWTARTHDVAGTLESQTDGAGQRQEPGEHLVGYMVREFSDEGTADAVTSGMGFGPDVKHAQAHHLVEHYAVHNGDDTCVAEDIAFSVTGSKGNPGAITDVGMVRKLTPLECERLQGFPDRWTEGLSDTRRYKTLGNAVAVPVANWLATRVAITHNKETQ